MYIYIYTWTFFGIQWYSAMTCDHTMTPSLALKETCFVLALPWLGTISKGIGAGAPWKSRLQRISVIQKTITILIIRTWSDISLTNSIRDFVCVCFWKVGCLCPVKFQKVGWWDAKGMGTSLFWYTGPDMVNSPVSRAPWWMVTTGLFGVDTEVQELVFAYSSLAARWIFL